MNDYEIMLKLARQHPIATTSNCKNCYIKDWPRLPREELNKHLAGHADSYAMRLDNVVVVDLDHPEYLTDKQRIIIRALIPETTIVFRRSAEETRDIAERGHFYFKRPAWLTDNGKFYRKPEKEENILEIRSGSSRLITIPPSVSGRDGFSYKWQNVEKLLQRNLPELPRTLYEYLRNHFIYKPYPIKVVAMNLEALRAKIRARAQAIKFGCDKPGGRPLSPSRAKELGAENICLVKGKDGVNRAYTRKAEHKGTVGTLRDKENKNKQAAFDARLETLGERIDAMDKDELRAIVKRIREKAGLAFGGNGLNKAHGDEAQEENSNKSETTEANPPLRVVERDYGKFGFSRRLTKDEFNKVRHLYKKRVDWFDDDKIYWELPEKSLEEAEKILGVKHGVATAKKEVQDRDQRKQQKMNARRELRKLFLESGDGKEIKTDKSLDGVKAIIHLDGGSYYAIKGNTIELVYGHNNTAIQYPRTPKREEALQEAYPEEYKRL